MYLFYLYLSFTDHDCDKWIDLDLFDILNLLQSHILVFFVSFLLFFI